MKKLLVLIAGVLLSVSSYGQTIEKNSDGVSDKFTIDLKSGIGETIPVTFKILGGKTLDSLYSNDRLIKLLEVSSFISNLELQYKMKQPTTYKPLATPNNKIMYSKGKISITLYCSAKNAYGNSLEKDYMILLKGDYTATGDALYKSIKVDWIL
jgi:hypothetical protein